MLTYEELVNYLFKTNAIKVCPNDKPFWYTSNKIGPYYINTQYLYGDETKANELLNVIENIRIDKENCSGIILDLTLENYQVDPIYKGLIDTMVNYIRNNIEEFDFVSGGERRDWFFSLIIAHFLKKPHITVFKDKSTVVFLPRTLEEELTCVENLRVLHIADIITEASSYARAWVPAIEEFGARITDSLVVVDRMQGGKERLESLGVKSHALAFVDIDLFRIAMKNELIDGAQFMMLESFIEDPFNSMRDFLIEHKTFLQEALESDPKTAARAKICIEEDLYKLSEEN
ncbi:MAG: orotate phosphoribosyltransferase [Bacillota bacterium]